MASDLGLTISVSGAVGAAMAAFGDLKGTLQQVSEITKKLKTDQGKLGNAIKNAAKLPQSDLGEMNARYAKQQELLTRLRASTQALGRARSNIDDNEKKRESLRTNMMETVALGLAVAAPIKVAIDAEEAFADVKKVVDTRVPELEAYLLEASRRIPQSFEELAKIASGGAQGGILRDELESYVDLVAKMSVAGDLTADFAGESVAKIKNIFGTNIARMGELGDVINNLSNRESAKYAQIIDVMKRSGSTAQIFGFNEKQTAGLATTFLALGKTEETAGTAINAMLLKLSAADVQAPKFQAALGKMGLSAQGLKKAIGKDAEGALTMFLEKVRQLPKENQLGLMSQMFGIQYADDVALLAQNVDVYKRTMKEAGDAEQYAGSMQKEFAERSATTKNAFRLLKNEMIVLAITLGKEVLPKLKALIDNVRPLIQRFAEWIKNNPATVSFLLHLVAGFLGFRFALLGVSYALSMISVPFLHAIKVYELFKAKFLLYKIGGLKSLFPGIAKAISAVGKAFTVLKGIILAHPIFAALALLAVAAFLVWKNWEKIKAGWPGFLAAAQDFLSDLVSMFTAPFKILLQLLFILLNGLADLIVAGLTRAFAAVRAAGAWIVAGIKSVFSGGLLGIAALLADFSPIGALYAMVARVLSWFGLTLPARFSEVGRMILGGIWSGFSSAFPNLAEKIKTWVGSLPDVVKKVLGIASPSRVFMAIGGETMAGLEQGLARTAQGPLEIVKRTVGALAAAGTLAAATPVLAAPMGPTGGGMASRAVAAPVSVTVNVYPAPGMDERALADLVVRKIADARRAEAVHRRSSLYDEE
ncbi:MAG: phage tail tape measure protein [Candidatus Accumulibacter sp.]|jgi:TP901 family phage tail tape measure protein|nr:phage tail tape measure protein [Accumulibacter sp.]